MTIAADSFDSSQHDSSHNGGLGSLEISDLLPQRPPFILVDRVLECFPGKSILCLKNLSLGEILWTHGHFPGKPIFPGVLIAEALGQAGAILMSLTRKCSNSPSQSPASKNAGVLGKVDIKFHLMARPGDQLYLHVEIVSQLGSLVKFKVCAKVNDRIAAEGYIVASEAEL